MTPRDARKAGASWGLSEARAWHDGTDDAAVEYRARLHAEMNAKIPVDLRAEFWAGHDAAYDAEWARLEGEHP